VSLLDILHAPILDVDIMFRQVEVGRTEFSGEDPDSDFNRTFVNVANTIAAKEVRDPLFGATPNPFALDRNRQGAVLLRLLRLSEDRG
jgi:hypothetical protein